MPATGIPLAWQVGVDATDIPLLTAVAERATASGETSHCEPFKVTAVAVRDAMLAADVLGRRYLAEAGVAVGTAAARPPKMNGA